MDTPRHDIQWMLRIDNLIVTEENRRQNQHAAAPAPHTPTIG